MSSTDSVAAGAKAQAAKAREELAATLDAIEDKLNVPKRIGELGGRARASYTRNPVPWVIGGAVSAAIALGVVAWAVFRDD